MAALQKKWGGAKNLCKKRAYNDFLTVTLKNGPYSIRKSRDTTKIFIDEAPSFLTEHHAQFKVIRLMGGVFIYTFFRPLTVHTKIKVL